MSIAWATIVVLVFLLPGFFFIFSLFYHERRSQGAALSSPTIPIVLALSAALAIHGGYYLFIDAWLPNLLPFIKKIDINLVFLSVQSEIDGKMLGKLSSNFSSNRFSIFLYIILTSWLGYISGSFWYSRAKSGRWPTFSKHNWINEISGGDNKVVLVYVLTKIQDSEKVLMYRGAIHEYYAKSDGSLEYIVLTGAKRYYMKLEDDIPTTSETANWKTISTSVSKSDGQKVESRLVIEGSDISNILYEIIQSEGPEEIKVQELQQKLETLVESIKKI